MKKTVSFILIILLLIIYPYNVYADSGNDDFSKIVGEINDTLKQSTDEDVNEILEKENISVEEPQSISDIKAENIFERIISYFTDGLKKPLVMLGRILAVSLICVVVKSMAPDKNSSAKVFELICTLSVIMIITDTISSNFETLKNSVERINTFMVSYIPIYVSVVSAGGNTISSSSYSAIMLLICEVMAFISSKILIPFLSVVLAVTLVSAINPHLQFSGIADSVKKCTIWILGTIMTVFVGLMTIQGLTGSAADNLAVKSLKFAASSFIPVIGSSISEAYSAVRGSMNVIKTSVGSIGIIIVFIVVLKPIITILAVKFILWLGRITNEIFGQREVSEILKSTNSVLSIGLSIIIAYAVVFIIATSVLMITAANVGG